MSTIQAIALSLGGAERHRTTRVRLPFSVQGVLSKCPMRFEQVKGWLRALLFRLVLLIAGGVVLAIALVINKGAGRAIIDGLLSPDSPNAIVVSVARLLM